MAKVRWFRRRGVQAVIVLLLAGGGYVGYQVWDLYGPSSTEIPISPETTYITEPLGANGLPDYKAVLLQDASAGVTPENNAAALLIHAFPKSRQAEISDEVLALLKVGRLDPADCLIVPDNYFVNDLPADLVASLPGTAMSPADIFQGQHDRAMLTTWTARQYPALAYWVAQNERPLAIAREASTRPRWFVVDPVSLPPLTAHLTSVRQIARGLVIRANLRAGEGRLDDAAQDLMTLHRVARLMAQGHGTLDHLVAISLESYACQGWNAIIDGCDLDRADAQRLLERLESLPPLPDFVSLVDRTERLEILYYLTRASREGMDSVFHDWIFKMGGATPRLPGARLNWSKVLRTYNGGMNEIVAAMKEPNVLVRLKKLDALQRKFQASAPRPLFQYLPQWLSFLKPNTSPDAEFLARRPAEYLLEGTANKRVSEIYFLTITKMELVKIGLAMAMYKADVGRWPARLEDMVPKYLRTVPIDCFSEKPYIYLPDKDGFVLYSIGDNLTDDHGTDRQDVVLRRTARARPSSTSVPAQTPATSPA